MSASFADIFLEAMRYEHWLRFYFADDAPDADEKAEQEGQDAIISVPAVMEELSRAEDAELVEILDALQGRIISMELSRDAVFACLGRRTALEVGSVAFNEELVRLSGDMSFRRQLDWFNAWVQELANNEIDLSGRALPPGAPQDEEVPSFAVWDAAFKFWYSLQKPLDGIDVATDK